MKISSAVDFGSKIIKKNISFYILFDKIIKSEKYRYTGFDRADPEAWGGGRRRGKPSS